MTAFVPIVSVVIGVMALSLFFQFVPMSLLLTAKSAGVDAVGFISLAGMRLRRTPQDGIVLPLVAAVKTRVPTTLLMLAAHRVARGIVARVVIALISANRAHIPISFEEISRLDSSGQGPSKLVRTIVNPNAAAPPIGRDDLHAVVRNPAKGRYNSPMDWVLSWLRGWRRF